MIQTREMDRVVMTVGPLTCSKKERGAASHYGERWKTCCCIWRVLQSCCSERWTTCNCPLWTRQADTQVQDLAGPLEHKLRHQTLNSRSLTAAGQQCIGSGPGMCCTQHAGHTCTLENGGCAVSPAEPCQHR